MLMGTVLRGKRRWNGGPCYEWREGEEGGEVEAGEEHQLLLSSF